MNEATLRIIDKAYSSCIGAISIDWYSSDNFQYIHLFVFDIKFHTEIAYEKKHPSFLMTISEIPLSNVESVLLNMAFEKRSNCLKKIIDGTIIRDQHDVIKKIQKFAVQLFTSSEIFFDHRFSRLINNVYTIQSFIYNSNAKQETYLFELLEIINLSKSIHPLMLKYLQNANEAIKEEYEYEFYAATRNTLKQYLNTGDQIIIKTCLDGFLKTLYQKFPVLDNSSLIILDINFDSLSITKFHRLIKEVFITHPIISHCYQYFYLSPEDSEFIYQNQISVVFETSDELKASFIQEKVTEILTKTYKKYNVSNLPTYASNLTDHNIIFRNFTSMGREVNKIISKLIEKTDDYSKEKGIMSGIVLSAYLLKKLDIVLKDLVIIEEDLTRRWMITKAELKKIKSETDYLNFKVLKRSLVESFYEKNSYFIDLAVKKGVSLTLEDNDKIYNDLIVATNNFISEINSKWYNNLTTDIYKALYKFDNAELVTKFNITFELLCNALLLTSEQRCMCLNGLYQGASKQMADTSFILNRDVQNKTK